MEVFGLGDSSKRPRLDIKSMNHPQRQYFLDWLRIGAMLLLIVFHVGMYYVSWDYHVKSPYASDALAPWMMLSEPWRLSLLFVVSGAATAYMLQRIEGWSFIGKRTLQLGLPLMCGIYLLVPPQTYFEVVQKYGYSGDFWHFLTLYYAHDASFCHNGACLVMPTWNHLWFLPYLWFYTLIIWVVHGSAPRLQSALIEGIENALSSWRLLVIPIVLLFLIRLELLAQFPTTHDFFHDWFNHARYFLLFVLGFYFAQIPHIWERFANYRRLSLALAIVAWALFLVTYRPVASIIEHVCLATLQWSAICAAIGFSHVYLNFDSPWRARLTQAVFPVYLFHQTVLIVATQLIAPAQLHPAQEAIGLMLITLGLSYMGYWVVRPIKFARVWFGIPA
jgi:hypothetical protein